MRDLLLALASLDYESPISNCIALLEQARARNFVTPLSPDHLPRITQAGKDALASGIGLAVVLDLHPGTLPE